ncbi:2-nitropropane dioxygenase-like enzyme [Desulfosporosinus orientis DSM 765]|uniref:Probable nitronate monooxygenase n=1 Tax=Desulfosporosinus orientis (strain ATCC 19365 / DSM 765 / NCIMB 8382 / VKM B-1628 / Singapore I) TaxID=768706 RepID=G7WGU0_DESOD|nr:nitronate monooxygenase [Desulfosporosinus orientis]AET68526.1 2-nitropropane dioxygenase-like enzyme [Desulfosporosinus orientis DSM 765]
MKTRITELLGIEHPIIAGGMQWISRAEIAAAISNAGALGTITAATHTTKEELITEIRKTRDLTDRPFGVNISMLPETTPGDMTSKFMEAIIEEKVPVVETSGRSPEAYVPALKKAGIKIIHKVPSIRFALKAERVGVDAVTIVGFECGGHPGIDDVTTFVMIPKAARLLSIPVLAGGGVADARGLLAALAMGAEGVVMGTRFVATKECVAHPNYKEWMVNASETDTMIILRSLRNPLRAIKNKAALKVLEMENRGAKLEELLTVVGGGIGRKALIEGDMENSTFALGQCIGNIEDVLPVRVVIEEMVEGAAKGMERMKSIFS